MAYVKTTPTTGTTVTCYLDTNDTGEEVTVQCHIVDTANLEDATPTLTDNVPLLVVKIGGTWCCPSLFRAT